jgi:hypothetical protein
VLLIGRNLGDVTWGRTGSLLDIVAVINNTSCNLSVCPRNIYETSLALCSRYSLRDCDVCELSKLLLLTCTPYLFSERFAIRKRSD